MNMRAPSSSFALASPASVRGQFQEYLFARSSKAIPVLPNHNGGKDVDIAKAKSGHTVQDQSVDGTFPRVSTNEIVDFVKARANLKTVKEVQRLTGLSEQAVKNLRLGSAGASAQTISTWCRNDPEFRAEYFYWCGGHLEVEPETVAALTIAINRIVQRKAREP